jgi:dihydrofolate synthase/folylpolyglutamate synthase
MGRHFSGTDELYSFLLDFVNVERGQKTVFMLDRMRALCAGLGDPQSAYRTVHIAGSKGKGSVAVMVARILEASGRRVGLYTSPHLLRWKERMSLAGDEMGEGPILAAAAEVLSIVEGKQPSDFPGDELPTFFELTTLIAFCAFRLVGCDRAVVETGLGGRLDSTNVMDSRASVITPIELEHSELLGGTIGQIAAEKAGIIKPGKPCYLSQQVPEARAVFVRTCAERGSPLREVGALAQARGVTVSAAGTQARISFEAGSPLSERFPTGIEARTPMIGAIQAENMTLALLAAAETEQDLGAEAAALGMAKAFLPARFQVLSLDPPVVLDGAHTPNSVHLALMSFEMLFPGPKALLFACAEDKMHGPMAAALGPRFDRITITRPGTFKKTDLTALAASFRAAGARFRLAEDHAEAIKQAREEAAAFGLPLLVTGSFYLCSEFARLSAT